MTRARVAWAIYLAIAGALAVYAVATWIGALLARDAVLYGEGAVANAARLARDRAAYLDLDPTAFVAANYPPFYLHLASLGDAFVAGRAASIVSTLVVAAAVFVAARPAGALAAGALAAGFLALAPVAIWGPAVKPDLVALALTVVAFVLLDRRRELAAVAAFALVLAALAKPTALLPAAAAAAWLAWADRGTLVRFAFGAAIGIAAGAAIVYLDSPGDVWRHVVVWNQLSWSLVQAALIAFLALVVVGATAAVAALRGAFRGARGAYLAGALGIVAFGGREGATINYLLDLAAAVSLGIAAIAPALRASVAFPLLAVAQLVVGTLAINPLRVVPGRPPSTGAWADPSRGGVEIFVHGSGRYLVEDSGLLARTPVVPVVDDLFLWSRLVERGVIDGEPILAQVRDARIASVISEVDLEHLEAAPAYERQRWADVLVREVLARYRLATHAGTLWIYEPR